MPVLVSEALAESRALLNDTAGALFTDTVLLPYTRKVYREFQSWGDTYGLQTTKRSTADLTPTTVSGNYTILTYTGTTPVLPADLRVPIRIYEKLVSDPRDAYVPLYETPFKALVNLAVTRTTFDSWATDGTTIYLPNLTSPGTRNILIDYIGSVITFANAASTLYDIHFQTYLASMTAALAAMFISQNESRAAALKADADEALDQILGVLVRKNQGAFGVRRIPFGSSRRVIDSWAKWNQN